MLYVRKEKRKKDVLQIAHMDVIEMVYVIQKMVKITATVLKIVKTKIMEEKTLVQCIGHRVIILHLRYNKDTDIWQTGIVVYQMLNPVGLVIVVQNLKTVYSHILHVHMNNVIGIEQKKEHAVLILH